MKYGKYLIVTLPDFRRHFDFKQFNKNRAQFVTDMHPDKVFYWDKKHIDAYHTISDWIISSQPIISCDIPSNIRKALHLLVGKEILTNSVENPLISMINLGKEINILDPGQDVNLPYDPSNIKKEAININLHKFCVSEDSDLTCTICIGNESREIRYGEVLYVTEINGSFIDFTSSYEENDFLSAQIIDSPGSFGSILVITDKVNGIKQSVHGVVSFILVDHGYIYVNENGKLISIGNETPMLLLRKTEFKAIQIKAKRDAIEVLYSNGVCKTTNSMNAIHGVTKI